MEAHARDPDLIPRSDLILSLTGPFVAGLDTVANTVSGFIYAVLKHPAVLKRVQADADALFAKGSIDEADVRNDLPNIDGAIMEAMRVYTIAVAQMRTATRDFAFLGHQIRAGELLYVATAVPHYMEEYYPNPGQVRHRPLRQAARRAPQARRLLPVRPRHAHLPGQDPRRGADGAVDGTPVLQAGPGARVPGLHARDQGAADPGTEHEVQGARQGHPPLRAGGGAARRYALIAFSMSLR